MGIAAPKCAVIEDSLVGVEAAKRAGMMPFLYDPAQQFSDDAGTGHLAFSDMALLPSLINQIY
jgi:beta-phosphoglucomutase-like phosphatase (HAD superfamily)